MSNTNNKNKNSSFWKKILVAGSYFAAAMSGEDKNMHSEKNSILKENDDAPEDHAYHLRKEDERYSVFQENQERMPIAMQQQINNPIDEWIIKEDEKSNIKKKDNNRLLQTTNTTPTGQAFQNITQLNTIRYYNYENINGTNASAADSAKIAGGTNSSIIEVNGNKYILLTTTNDPTAKYIPLNASSNNIFGLTQLTSLSVNKIDDVPTYNVSGRLSGAKYNYNFTLSPTNIMKIENSAIKEKIKEIVNVGDDKSTTIQSSSLTNFPIALTADSFNNSSYLEESSGGKILIKIDNKTIALNKTSSNNYIAYQPEVITKESDKVSISSQIAKTCDNQTLSTLQSIFPNFNITSKIPLGDDLQVAICLEKDANNEATIKCINYKNQILTEKSIFNQTTKVCPEKFCPKPIPTPETQPQTESKLDVKLIAGGVAGGVAGVSAIATLIAAVVSCMHIKDLKSNRKIKLEDRKELLEALLKIMNYPEVANKILEKLHNEFNNKFALPEDSKTPLVTKKIENFGINEISILFESEEALKKFSQVLIETSKAIPKETKSIKDVDRNFLLDKLLPDIEEAIKNNNQSNSNYRTINVDNDELNQIPENIQKAICENLGNILLLTNECQELQRELETSELKKLKKNIEDIKKSFVEKIDNIEANLIINLPEDKNKIKESEFQMLAQASQDEATEKRTGSKKSKTMENKKEEDQNKEIENLLNSIEKEDKKSPLNDENYYGKKLFEESLDKLTKEKTEIDLKLCNEKFKDEKKQLTDQKKQIEGRIKRQEALLDGNSENYKSLKEKQEKIRKIKEDLKSLKSNKEINLGKFNTTKENCRKYTENTLRDLFLMEDYSRIIKILASKKLEIAAKEEKEEEKKEAKTATIEEFKENLEYFKLMTEGIIDTNVISKKVEELSEKLNKELTALANVKKEQNSLQNAINNNNGENSLMEIHLKKNSARENQNSHEEKVESINVDKAVSASIFNINKSPSSSSNQSEKQDKSVHNSESHTALKRVPEKTNQLNTDDDFVYLPPIDSKSFDEAKMKAINNEVINQSNQLSQ